MFTITDQVTNPSGISATDIQMGDGSVAEAIAKKQDAETGKGLSANDYTNDEKAKLAALPTNTALQSALDGKQAAGNYAINGTAENGGGLKAFSKGAYIGGYKEGFQISGVDTDGTRVALNIVDNTIKLFRDEGEGDGWKNTQTYTADEDTGWQNAINTMVPIKSRKKNGMVTVTIYAAVTQAMAANTNHTVGTLVAGHKPDTSIAFMANCKDTLFYRGYVDQNGKVGIVTQGTALAVGDTIRATVSFPV